jgi:deoxyadenosine/deoxycytidine kinase
MMGSGKTTLARGLSSVLGWMYQPSKNTATNYIPDLFIKPERWAFESQLSFFIQKALIIDNCIKKRLNFILDRSIQEDQHVFFKYFYQKGFIDERANTNYLSLSHYFNELLPKPDIILYCDSNFESNRKRIIERNRDYQQKYPKNHLKDIYDLYSEWVKSLNHEQVYSIKSDLIDYRQPKILNQIAQDILSILKGKKILYQQLSLFDNEDEVYEQYNLKLLSPMSEIGNIVTPPSLPNIKIDSPKFSLPFPSAYIAAPFTGVAEDSQIKKSKHKTLFGEAEFHGALNEGKYRTTLLKTANSIRKRGIWPFLPHKDINQWGKKQLTPKEIVELCTNFVEKADLFIGILSISHGSHYEFGIAYGNRKPSIIISCNELNSSFINKGISDQLSNVIHLKCDKISQIPKLLESQTAINFMKKYIPIK